MLSRSSCHLTTYRKQLHKVGARSIPNNATKVIDSKPIASQHDCSRKHWLIPALRRQDTSAFGLSTNRLGHAVRRSQQYANYRSGKLTQLSTLCVCACVCRSADQSKRPFFLLCLSTSLGRSTFLSEYGTLASIVIYSAAATFIEECIWP